MSDEDEDYQSHNDPAGVRVRLAKMAMKREAAEKRAAELEAQIAEIQAAHAGALEGLQARIGELEPFQSQAAELAKERASWTAERAIMGAGITNPEGVTFARMAWDMLPEDARPEGGLADWLGEDNRENLPKAVTAYFAQPAEAPAQRPPVDPNRGVRREPTRTAPGGGGGDWASRREAELADLGIALPTYGKEA